MAFKLDLWSGADFKETFRELTAAAGVRAERLGPVKGWARDHERRLQAYNLLSAYERNTGRIWMKTVGNDPLMPGPAGGVNARREHGDVSLLVRQTAAALMGDSQRFHVEGSGDPEDTDAVAWQAFFDNWVTKEQAVNRLRVSERTAVGLGDGVLQFGYNERAKRVSMRSVDPGFFFPFQDQYSDDEFPDRVDLAWEWKERIGDREELLLRLITYELVDTGRYIVRPWGNSPWQCYVTDRVYRADRMGDVRVGYEFGDKGLLRTLRDREPVGGPNGLDIIPILHVPNTMTGEVWGESTIMPVLQVIDDIAATDTDLALNVGTTGSPIITLSGTPLIKDKPLTYGPGSLWHLGDNGRMDVLDTSSGLRALGVHLESLLQRLSVNARIPQAMLGRVDPGNVPSGLAFQLAFAPTTSMVTEMRGVRTPKYELMMRIVSRIALAAGAKLPAKFPGGTVEYGAFLPTDRAETVTTITQLLDRKALSTETAIRLVAASGLNVPDLAQELLKIKAEDTGRAVTLNAMFGPKAAAEYLQLSLDVISTSPTGDGTPSGGNTAPAGK